MARSKFSGHPISRSPDHAILLRFLPHHNLVNDFTLTGLALGDFQRDLVLLLILHCTADCHSIVISAGLEVRSRQYWLLIESTLELALDARVAGVSRRFGIRWHLLGWRLLIGRGVVAARLRIRIERRRTRHRLLPEHNSCNKKQESTYNAFHRTSYAYLDAREAISR